MIRTRSSHGDEGRALAFGILACTSEPVVILDAKSCVLAASPAFFRLFSVSPRHAKGRHFYELGKGKWDLPKLKYLFEEFIPAYRAIENYEVDHDFPGKGNFKMLLSAHRLHPRGSSAIILKIADPDRLQAGNRKTDDLLRQKDILLEEIEHRIANSLQIIASIILLKANRVKSDETRRHLHDAHDRVISVAAVQHHLHSAASSSMVEMLPYLSKVCEALSQAMIGDDRPIALAVSGSMGAVSSKDAECLGLIVTESVINSLKHAFSDDCANRRISVDYRISGSGWKLSISDNGKGGGSVGPPAKPMPGAGAGIGAGIVKALARQLVAIVDTESGANGTVVSISGLVR